MLGNLFSKKDSNCRHGTNYDSDRYLAMNSGWIFKCSEKQLFTYIPVATALTKAFCVEPELGNLRGAGAQIKNQEPELSLKFRSGAEAIAI